MRRGAVFIVATALAAAVLFFVFPKKIDNILTRPAGPVTLPEYHDAAKPIGVTVGREFSIALEADKTTGLRWQLEPTFDKSCLQVVEIKHNVSKTKQGGRQIKDLWTFKGLREGEMAVSFKAARPRGSETNAVPTAQRIFTVSIRKEP